MPKNRSEYFRITGGSKTQVTGHCFTDTLTPFLMLTFLSATLRQSFRPKHYTETIFRLKISISKGLGCSSIDKTMTRDLHFRPAIELPATDEIRMEDR